MEGGKSLVALSLGNLSRLNLMDTSRRRGSPGAWVSSGGSGPDMPSKMVEVEVEEVVLRPPLVAYHW